MKIIAAHADAPSADGLKTLQIANDADLAALAADGALQGVDRIELDDFSAAQVRLAISAAQQVGDNLVLALSSDTVIVLKDMEKAQLDMNDFLL